MGFNIGDMVSYADDDGDNDSAQSFGKIISIDGDNATVLEHQLDPNGELFATGDNDVVPLMALIAYDPTEGKTAKPAETKAAETAVAAPAKPVIFMDGTTTIKALGNDRVGGYLVVFGSPDQKDLTGEYFTANTDFGLEHYGDKRPMLYHHNKDRVIGKTAIGTIDTIKADEIGLWAEGQLNNRNRYVAGVKTLIAKGALGWSSGALPQSVEKAADGEIKAWWIGEGSLTPEPAEPRNTGVCMKYFADVDITRQACKALDIATEWLGTETSGLHDQESVRAGNNSRSDRSLANETVRVIQGTTKMEITQESLSAMVAKAATDAIAAMEATKSAKADAAAAENARIEAEVQKRLATIAPAAETSEKAVTVNAASNKLANAPAPALKAASQVEVVRATKYSQFSASALSLLAQMSKSFKKPLPEEFYAELADKTVKAVNAGKLPYEAVDGLTKAGYFTNGVSAAINAIKANELSSDAQAGSGAEWDADSWRAELWLRVRQDNVIAPALQMLEMPTNPYELPIESADPTVYSTPETTDQAMQVYTAANPIGQSKVTTAKVQMKAAKLAMRIGWSAELNEDSIIPILENYQRQSIRAVLNAIDNTLINGDTATGASTNINLIDGTPGTVPTAPSYLAFNGLRKYCLVTNTAQAFNIVNGTTAGPVTVTALRKLRFKLKGAYALRPKDCMLIVDDLTYGKLLSLPEFITMDKAGELATNLTGQVGIIDGVPVFATAEMGLSQPSNGDISGTPANNTTGQAIMCFRPLWYVGYRRDVSARLSFLDFADSWHLTVTARLTMAPQDTLSAALMWGISV